VSVAVPDCRATVTVVVAVTAAVVVFVGKYGCPNATLNLLSQQLDPSVVPQHHCWSFVAAAIPPPQSNILAKFVRSASTIHGTRVLTNRTLLRVEEEVCLTQKAWDEIMVGTGEGRTNRQSCISAHNLTMSKWNRCIRPGRRNSRFLCSSRLPCRRSSADHSMLRGQDRRQGCKLDSYTE